MGEAVAGVVCGKCQQYTGRNYISLTFDDSGKVVAWALEHVSPKPPRTPTHPRFISLNPGRPFFSFSPLSSFPWVQRCSSLLSSQLLGNGSGLEDLAGEVRQSKRYPASCEISYLPTQLASVHVSTVGGRFFLFPLKHLFQLSSSASLGQDPFPRSLEPWVSWSTLTSDTTSSQVRKPRPVDQDSGR